MHRHWKQLIKLGLFSLAFWKFIGVNQDHLPWNQEREVFQTEITVSDPAPTRVIPPSLLTPKATSSIPTPTLPDAQKTIDRRKNRVASFCAGHASDQILFNSRHRAMGGLFFSDNRRKLFFALNFKVGASTLIRSIPNSSGLVPPNEIPELKYVDLSTPTRLRKYGLSVASTTTHKFPKNYQSYYKFMFVRNPYHRLMSAFRDKLRIHPKSQLPDEWFTTTRNHIIRKYRTDNNTVLTAKLNETEVTFEEFLRYVLDDITEYKSTNQHWKPLHLLSMPCVVKYDFIGKFETFEQDFRQLMSRIAVVDVPLSKFHSAPGASTLQVFKRYWQQIPQEVLERIKSVYEKDFEMFNYNKDLTLYL